MAAPLLSQPLPLEPQPSAEDAADEWSNSRAYTEKHQVHKVTGEGANKEYIVSNLRKFDMSMVLMDKDPAALQQALAPRRPHL